MFSKLWVFLTGKEVVYLVDFDGAINKTFAFKKHSYDIAFELVAPNSLKITRTVKTPWDDIKTSEYIDYKAFVEEVLTVEEQVVGFK